MTRPKEIVEILDHIIERSFDRSEDPHKLVMLLASAVRDLLVPPLPAPTVLPDAEEASDKRAGVAAPLKHCDGKVPPHLAGVNGGRCVYVPPPDTPI